MGFEICTYVGTYVCLYVFTCAYIRTKYRRMARVAKYEFLLSSMDRNMYVCIWAHMYICMVAV